VDVNGSGWGAMGRLIFGNSQGLPFSGSTSGASITSVTGPRTSNPFLLDSALTPYIPVCADGPEAFGLLDGLTASSPEFADVVRHAPVGAKAALMRSHALTPGTDAPYPGYDILYFINLSGQELPTPFLGVGNLTQTYAKALQLGGYLRRQEFGGSGFSTLTTLPAGAVYVTLVPANAAGFTFGFQSTPMILQATKPRLQFDKPLYLPRPPLCQLTYSSGLNGHVEGELNQSLDYREDGTPVRAVPATGHRFWMWSDGSMQNPRTDKDVTTSISVYAIYTQQAPSSTLITF
jgi:hypothetical protein